MHSLRIPASHTHNDGLFSELMLENGRRSGIDTSGDRFLGCRDLKHLYGEVVKGGLVTDMDFWKSRQSLVLSKAGSAGEKQQVVGLSSALLAQFLPDADGRKQVTALPPYLTALHSLVKFGAGRVCQDVQSLSHRLALFMPALPRKFPVGF
jgi:hypothetical protein